MKLPTCCLLLGTIPHIYETLYERVLCEYQYYVEKVIEYDGREGECIGCLPGNCGVIIWPVKDWFSADGRAEIWEIEVKKTR